MLVLKFFVSLVFAGFLGIRCLNQGTSPEEAHVIAGLAFVGTFLLLTI